MGEHRTIYLCMDCRAVLSTRRATLRPKPSPCGYTRHIILHTPRLDRSFYLHHSPRTLCRILSSLLRQEVQLYLTLPIVHPPSPRSCIRLFLWSLLDETRLSSSTSNPPSYLCVGSRNRPLATLHMVERRRFLRRSAEDTVRLPVFEGCKRLTQLSSLVISNTWPFLDFLTVFLIPYMYWVLGIELAVYMNGQNDVTISYGQVSHAQFGRMRGRSQALNQILSAFAAIPPVIELSRVRVRAYRGHRHRSKAADLEYG